MIIRNATAFIGESFRAETDIRLKHGQVTELGHHLSAGLYEAETDVQGDYVIPGFVDVHIHAFRGQDMMQGEDAIRHMSRELYREGVAAFLPTTMCASASDTANAVLAAGEAMRTPEKNGARVLGVHMEAPFLSPQKAGAQRREFMCDPDMDTLMAFCGNRPDLVRLITIAPEKNGTEAFVKAAVSIGIHVSVGHTTASAEQTHLAADWGADHVTHTFNAQTAFNHREPGVPGAAMCDDRFYAEIIADGIHLHPDTIRTLYRAKGAKRTLVVTDAMEAAGMPDGEYQLGGLPVHVAEGQARLSDGTLAGSVLRMPGALHNLIHRFGIRPEDAVLMCTTTPACSIGERLCGRIAVDAPAPLTRWSPDWEMVSILDDRTDR